MANLPLKDAVFFFFVLGDLHAGDLLAGRHLHVGDFHVGQEARGRFARCKHDDLHAFGKKNTKQKITVKQLK